MTGRAVFFAIPGDLDTPTGGYGYDRRLIAELPGFGWEAELVPLPAGFPLPTRGTVAEATDILAGLPPGAVVIVDGLAFGAMPEVSRDLANTLRLVALVHHPLADETGLAREDAARLEQSEREALRHARRVICTSRTTAKRLIDAFGVDPSCLTVAPPGTDRRPRAKGGGLEPVILSLAAVVRRKGHDVLIQALSRLVDRVWSCRIVGALDRDPEWVAFLQAQAARLGLAERIHFVGPVRDADAELRRADIFALPSRHEGYGMAFAEALAHGLPIVACDAGAVPEVVPPDAGHLVPVDDADAVAAAITGLLDDRAGRGRMAAAAWKAGRALPGWRETARIVVGALREAAR